MERARHFAEKSEPMDEHLSASGVEKAWNRYRDAAPYIYAFYPTLYFVDSQAGSFAETKKITEEDWISRIALLAERSTLDECLGHAAFAADVLAKTTTRVVRDNDFKAVARKEPMWREFDADELFLINTFTKTAPIK